MVADRLRRALGGVSDYRAAQQRAALGLPDPDDETEVTTLTLAHWAYAGHGRRNRPASSGWMH